MVRIRGNRRHARWLAVGALLTVLTACSHSDPVNDLKAGGMHDTKAAAKCSAWDNGRGAKYTIATKDATVGEVRAHITKTMDDTAFRSNELSILAGHPDDEYVALCLLKTPEGVQLAAQFAGLPGPMTLALLADGSSLWADTGPKP
jgi:hypothetical protein